MSHYNCLEERGLLLAPPLYLVTEVSANQRRVPYSSTNGKFRCSSAVSKQKFNWIKLGRRIQRRKWI